MKTEIKRESVLFKWESDEEYIRTVTFAIYVDSNKICNCITELTAKRVIEAIENYAIPEEQFKIIS